MAFTIGYTPEERVKLADAAMSEFKRIWGRYPASVASWNLDAITMAHLTTTYGIDAYAVCRDQIATDGFTIWGAPIAGYYPSKTNAWSPALDRGHQIGTPVFRMLGQDPVYYYDHRTRLPGGQVEREPDTMEPVWTSGRSPVFVREFLKMIADAPTMEFGYAQLGQENSFPWPDQAQAYEPQMAALARLRKEGKVHVETMGASGRRFKRAFRTTPAQAQVMLDDPYGNAESPEGSIWYGNRFYRVDLHIKGDLPYLRDLTVYSDRSDQPFLQEATRLHEVPQRLPAILDGYHWSKRPDSLTEIGAGGFFHDGDEPLKIVGKPEVTEAGNSLHVRLPIQSGRTLILEFREREIVARLTPSVRAKLTLAFRWDSQKSALTAVQPKRVTYRWEGLEYDARLIEGVAHPTPDGWTVVSERKGLRIDVAQ